MVYLGVFSGDFFVEFALREVPERGTNWCAHDVFERDVVPFLLVVLTCGFGVLSFHYEDTEVLFFLLLICALKKKIEVV